jgi:hypothetical protein
MPPPNPPDIGIDRTVPLLLLPVRIETRFDVDGPRRDLLVRIYPDHAHVDSHRPALTPAEEAHGQTFWRSAWVGSTAREALDLAFARMARRLGSYRAAWVLEATRPANWDRRGSPARRGGQTPRFPSLDDVSPAAPAPAMARLLPDRWVVSGYQQRERKFTAEGRAIQRDLPVAPELAASGQAPRTMRELMQAQGLSWLRDFEAAVAVGMALRIALHREVQLQQSFDIFVIGLRRGEAAEDAARALAELLAAHQWTHGLDFGRRGTPTNNTDRARSAVSVSAPDLPDLLDTVLARPDPRPKVGLLPSHQPFAHAARQALGLGPGSILERVPHRDDTQLDLGAAMSAALWPATWGYFLRTMVVGAVPDQWIDWTRRHFIDHVRGGGILPALRLGRQPYGLLPVAAETSRPAAGDRVQTLENLLLELLPAWSEAVQGRVAHLDPDATDLSGTTEPSPETLASAVTTLGRTLGATPNPSDLILRPVTDKTDVYAGASGLMILVLGRLLEPFPSIAASLGEDLFAAATLEEQIAVLERTVASGNPSVDDYDPTYPSGPLYLEANSPINDAATEAAAQNAIDFIEASLLPLFYNHRQRAAPLLDLGPDRREVTGLMPDGSDPALFLSFLGEDTARASWTAPVVSADPAATDEVARWLDALVAEAADPAAPAVAPTSPAPLLFQLLRRALGVAHASDRADLVAGLRTLAAAVRDGRLAEPVADLETLMGEVLGTCMHRLDAWLSGAAALRLQALRASRPRGVQIGAFGWVTGLRRATQDGPSQGFIHAPTLDHAATAAIIRSGWSGLGDGALGVDISSARARAATWLVDGLRDGRGLDDLLGQSLERRLHDARLDRYVERIRRAVLNGTGQGRRPPSKVTDGHVVARAWIGGDEVAPLTDEESKVRTEVTRVVTEAGPDARPLRTLLDAHAADLDSVADATLVQAVHAIVRGNPDQAAAALTGAGSGDGGPAALTALGTPRGGRRITHRVLVLLDAVEPPSELPPDPALISPAAVAEPSLEGWLAAALPPLDQVVYGAWIEANGTRTWRGPLTLAGAGFGWLELLEDLPSKDRLAWRLAREAAASGQVVSVEIDGDAGDQARAGQLPLRLFLPAALALRGLLRAGRATDAADLAALPTASTADVATVAGREVLLVEAAARPAASALRTALDEDAATADLLDALTALARWHVPGAIPRAGLRDLATGADAGDRAALIAEAEAVHARFQARLDARDAIAGDDLTAAVTRIRALLPGAVVLPPFVAPSVPTLEAAAARSGTRLGGVANAIPWLQQSGRVRPRVGAAVAAIDLVEAASGGARFQPVLLQLPDHPEEGWAATTLPSHDTGPRTCLLSISGRPADFTAMMAGLVLDAWTEVIPDRTVTTGIAVHFDAPSAQAPQAFLLAVPPAEGPWGVDQILALVRQTLDRARERAVGPDEIQGYGQYLPAIYLGDDVDPGAPAAASLASAPGGRS